MVLLYPGFDQERVAERTLTSDTVAERDRNQGFLRFGSPEAEILTVDLLPLEVESGQPLQIEIEYLAPEPIESPIFSVSICREDGQICCDINTSDQGLILPRIIGQGKLRLAIDRLDLVVGDYYVHVGIYKQGWDYAYDYHWHVYPLRVRSSISIKGILHPPYQWHVQSVSQFK